MLKLKFLVGLAFVLAVSNETSFAKDDLWSFTANEIANAYRYQLQFGARLRNPMEPHACSYGQKEFLASYQGRTFMAPCRFIAETVRQLKELLESGAARYLFPLDVDYADLAVPGEIYASKYKKLAKNEILPALLHEPTLVAIYHTAVHLDRQLSKEGSEVSPLWAKRAVMGFYDGRPNQILFPRSDGEAHDKPQELVQLGSFNIMAHFLGEIVLVAKETPVTFDLSFDNDRAAAPNADIATVSAAAR